MTVKMMIEELQKYNQNAQVVDTYGSPIIYVVDQPSAWMKNENNVVRLEPKTQIDVNCELDAFLKFLEENSCETDIDVLTEFAERGYTLEDIKEYRNDVYKWACKTIKENYNPFK